LGLIIWRQKSAGVNKAVYVYCDQIIHGTVGIHGTSGRNVGHLKHMGESTHNVGDN
jgi:hypothetical protein